MYKECLFLDKKERDFYYYHCIFFVCEISWVKNGLFDQANLLITDKLYTNLSNSGISPYCRHSMFCVIRLARSTIHTIIHSTLKNMVHNRTKGYTSNYYLNHIKFITSHLLASLYFVSPFVKNVSSMILVSSLLFAPIDLYTSHTHVFGFSRVDVYYHQIMN